jgi:hypothetical protein
MPPPQKGDGMQDKRAGHALMDWIRSVPPRRPRIKHEALEGGLLTGG